MAPDPVARLALVPLAAADVDGRPAGAVIAFPQETGHHVLGCVFTDPEVQRRSVGLALMRHDPDGVGAVFVFRKGA